jgi:hypothetical protein
MRDPLTTILGLAAGILPAWAAVFLFATSNTFFALLFVVATYMMVFMSPQAMYGSAAVFGITALVYAFMANFTPAGIYGIFCLGCFIVFYFAS